MHEVTIIFRVMGLAMAIDSQSLRLRIVIRRDGTDIDRSLRPGRIATGHGDQSPALSGGQHRLARPRAAFRISPLIRGRKPVLSLVSESVAPRRPDLRCNTYIDREGLDFGQCICRKMNNLVVSGPYGSTTGPRKRRPHEPTC
jgi:hypothetical protein